MPRRGSPLRFALVLAGLSLFAACSEPPPQATRKTGAAPVGNAPGGRGVGTIEIVILGDSLSSGTGLLSNQEYPAILQEKFAGEGYANVTTVNASVSGDTTAGGLRRVQSALTNETRILVVALGGNDGLRGLTQAQTHDNLAGIIDVALNRNVAVLVAGMEAPPNYGEDYRQTFHEIYTRLLSEYRGRIALMPFLLDGVAGVPSLNQSDGIHPNADGARKIAENMYQLLQPIVDAIG